MFWHQTIQGRKIEFSNTPVMVCAIRNLDCQFGKHYYRSAGPEEAIFMWSGRVLKCWA